MKTESVCVVTGGAGFIGSALSPGLVKRFNRVLVLDKLLPQIHGPTPVRSAALHASVEFHHADIAQRAIWDELLSSIRPKVVVHLAAETGTGQSLTEASRHAQENVLGTAVMLDALSRRGRVPEHIVLRRAVRSMAKAPGSGGTDRAFIRASAIANNSLAANGIIWTSQHLPFSAESTEPRPCSVYGGTKFAQEHILEAWALAFGANLTICRSQNVYGRGQSLINSYTRIVSLFARLAREGNSIPLYEDGRMLRDFVYNDDIANALFAAIDVRPTVSTRFDIGLGSAATISRVATLIARRYCAPEPHACGAYRQGDVRHASCDISAAMRQLQWTPQWSLERGLRGPLPLDRRRA